MPIKFFIIFSILTALITGCQKCTPPSSDIVPPTTGLRVDYKNISNDYQYIDLVSTNDDPTIIIPTLWEGRELSVIYSASDDGCLKLVRIRNEKITINTNGQEVPQNGGDWKDYNRSWQPVKKFIVKLYPKISNPSRYDIYNYDIYALDCHSNLSSSHLRIKFRPITNTEGPIIMKLNNSGQQNGSVWKCRFTAYDRVSFDINARIKKAAFSFQTPVSKTIANKWLMKIGDTELKDFKQDGQDNTYSKSLDIPLKAYDIELRLLSGIMGPAAMEDPNTTLTLYLE
jgi:hypothetical protein